MRAPIGHTDKSLGYAPNAQRRNALSTDAAGRRAAGDESARTRARARDQSGEAQLLPSCPGGEGTDKGDQLQEQQEQSALPVLSDAPRSRRAGAHHNSIP